MATKLPKNYKPSKTEKFMNAKQKEYFRLKLKNWKNDIYQESRETVENLQDSIAPADVSDRATQESEKGMPLPVVINVYEDKTFDFVVKTPPAAVLIRKALNIQKGSGEPNREKVGKLSRSQLEDIAKAKEPDLNANDIDAAVKIIAGTARSMGVETDL